MSDGKTHGACDSAGDQGIIDAALAIAKERENTTRRLARAVLNEDFETAKQIAEELIPNEARSRSSNNAQ